MHEVFLFSGLPYPPPYLHCSTLTLTERADKQRNRNIRQTNSLIKLINLTDKRTDECVFVYQSTCHYESQSHLWNWLIWTWIWLGNAHFLSCHRASAVTRIRTEKQTHTLTYTQTGGYIEKSAWQSVFQAVRQWWTLLWQRCCCTSWGSMLISSKLCTYSRTAHSVQHTLFWRIKHRIMHVVYKYADTQTTTHTNIFPTSHNYYSTEQLRFYSLQRFSIILEWYK